MVLDVLDLASKAVCGNKRLSIGCDTPGWVCSDILGMLPDDFWEQPRGILELNFKSTSFYDVCKKRYKEKGVSFSDALYYKVVLHEGLCWLYSNKFSESTVVYTRGSYDLEATLMKLGSMKFDLVVGNPPYSNNDGSGHGGGGQEAYVSFVEAAYKYSSRYVCMILPARWYTGGRGKQLPEFRRFMLDDAHIKKFHDYIDSTAIFDKSQAYIAGGICYFLGDKQYNDGLVEWHSHDRSGNEKIETRHMRVTLDDILVRDSAMAEVLEHVIKTDGFCDKDGQVEYKNFSAFLSAQKPYGLRADSYYESGMSYDCTDFNLITEGGYRCIGIDYDALSGVRCRAIRWYHNELPRELWPVDTYRVFFAKALFDKNDRFCIESIVAKPGDICTETFLCAGGFESTYETAFNVASYMKTKFFRYLLTLFKQDQNTCQDTYRAIPVQDFSICWTDEMLYEKYHLPQYLIDTIESSIMTDTSPVRCDLTEVKGVS